MRHLRTVAVTAFVLVGLPIILTSAAAHAPTPPGEIPQAAFRTVEVSDAVVNVSPPVTFTQVPATPTPSPSPTPRQRELQAKAAQPLPTPRPTPTPKPKAKTLAASNTGRSVRVHATWYCRAGRSVCHYKYPDRAGVIDMYAAAGSRVRVGNWRGRVVHVCDSNSCINVKLIDWCGCPGIDLYWDAFHKLAPNNGGENSVTVSW